MYIKTLFSPQLQASTKRPLSESKSGLEFYSLESIIRRPLVLGGDTTYLWGLGYHTEYKELSKNLLTKCEIRVWYPAKLSLKWKYRAKKCEVTPKYVYLRKLLEKVFHQNGEINQENWKCKIQEIKDPT